MADQAMAGVGDRRRRRDPRRAVTRGKLLEATLALLQQGGPGALSVSGIAREAGVKAPIFYAHFEDLGACMTAAARVAIEALQAEDARLRAGLGLSGRTAIVLMLRAAFDRWLSIGPLVELVVRHRLDGSAFGQALRPYFERFEDELAHEVSSKATTAGVGQHVDGDDIRAMARAQAAAFFWGLEALTVGGSADRARVAEIVADMLLAAIGPVLGRPDCAQRTAQIRERHDPDRRAAIAEMRTAWEDALETHDEASLVAEHGLETLVDMALTGMVEALLPTKVATRRARIGFVVSPTDNPTAAAVVRNLNVDSGQVSIACGGGHTDAALVLPLRALRQLLGGQTPDVPYRAHGDVALLVEMAEWFYFPPVDDALLHAAAQTARAYPAPSNPQGKP